MAELAIRISDKDAPEVMERKVTIVHWVGNSINSLSACFMLLLSVWFMFVLVIFYSGCNKISTTDVQCCGVYKFLNYMAVLGWVSGIMYSLLTVALVLSFIRL
jgi:archaellum biogenesis protein FlaJ (TadC family)